jgi:Glycosyl transferase family 2
MKVVETLLVRDEVDVVGAHLAFNLNAGVDFVLAIDHESQDGTTEVLENYVSSGVVKRIPVTGRFREQQWRTMLARIAAADYAADWVINSDADQFWWPRIGTLHDALATVPGEVVAVRSWDRVFVPTPDDGAHFVERMTFRLVSHVPLNVPWSNYRPLPRVIHRGDPGITVSRGGHSVWMPSMRPYSWWSPVEALHFPWRSIEQMTKKAGVMERAFADESQRPGGYHTAAGHALSRGTLEAHYASLAVGREALSRGVETGCLVEDMRVRDVLRSLAGARSLRDRPAGSFDSPPGGRRVAPAPETATMGIELALETIAAEEAELVRLQRRVDELGSRADALRPGWRRP